MLQSKRLTSYAMVRDEVMDVVQARAAAGSPPMLVGALMKGKGSGKGTKGKGESKDTNSEAKDSRDTQDSKDSAQRCVHCDRTGHV